MHPDCAKTLSAIPPATHPAHTPTAANGKAEAVKTQQGGRLTYRTEDRSWMLMNATAGKSYRTLIAGLPGTGKSNFFQKWGMMNGYEVMSVTMTPETQPSEMVGHFGVQDGDFVWLDQIFAKAWRATHDTETEAGKRVIMVIDEIDHTGGAAMSTLQGLLNDPQLCRLDLPTGEVLRPVPGRLFYVGTMNGSPDELPPAIRDRFPVCYTVMTPNPEAIEALPEDLQQVARNACSLTDEARRLSVRPFFAFHELREGGVAEDLAAESVFADRAGELMDALRIAQNAEERD
jgi:MoxR-like ATPase